MKKYIGIIALSFIGSGVVFAQSNEPAKQDAPKVQEEKTAPVHSENRELKNKGTTESVQLNAQSETSQNTAKQDGPKTKTATKAETKSNSQSSSAKVNPDGTVSEPAKADKSETTTKKSGTRMAINEKALPAKKHKKPKTNSNK
ncbi:MAG: hypothetical protein AB7O73_08755 [Bacteroidia bacterium]